MVTETRQMAIQYLALYQILYTDENQFQHTAIQIYKSETDKWEEYCMSGALKSLSFLFCFFYLTSKYTTLIIH